MSEALDAHNGEMLAVIDRFDGDLQFFAGDGALILWRASSAAGLAGVVAAARDAALVLADRLEGPSGILPSRSIVTAGTLTSLMVGSGDQWLHLLGGDAVRQISAAGAAPVSSAGTLSPEATAILAAESPGQYVLPARGASAFADLKNRAAGAELFLLPHVAASLGAGHADFMAEFRAVSVAFVDLRKLGWDLDISRLQSVVAEIRQSLSEFGGLLYQLVQDDKGTYAIAAFGLAGTAHDDAAVRAVRFARAARRRLEPALGQVACGVATGSVFCSDCGGPARRQYSMFGGALNRAARLMAAADDVLVDQATFRQAERKLYFDVRAPLNLKGLGEVAAFAGGEPRRAPPPEHAFVGRARELAALRARLTAFRDGGPAPTVVTEGPPGIGKTAFLGQLAQVADEIGLLVAFGVADPFEKRTPYFALREVARRLLGVGRGISPELLLRTVEDRLRDIGRDPQLAPLLGPVLGHGFDETPLTRSMTGPVRAENGNALIEALLGAATASQRWFIVLDDVHWLDEASRGILPALRRGLPQVAWVLSARTDELPPSFSPIAAGAERCVLTGLAREEVAALVGDEWGVDEIGEETLSFLIERAASNPLFCRELARSLLERGRVFCEDGRGTLRAGKTPAEEALPTTLAALIQSRVDRLGEGPLFTLKLASILGLSFELDWLRPLVPAGSDGEALSASLQALVDDGCLRVESDAGVSRFAFSHALIQSATYQTLPDRQRRALHGQAGAVLEGLYARDLSPVLGRLSHHFSEGGDVARATRYAALAASQALDGYANEDAIHLFERALDGDEVVRGKLRVDLERARWLSGIAQAQYSLARHHKAHVAYGRALRMLGWHEPRGLLLLGWGFLRVVLGRLRRRSVARRPPSARLELDQLALSLIWSWGTLDVWQGRLVAAAAKAFAGHRLALRSGETGSAAEGIASLGYFLGITPLRRWGETELRTAVATADRSGDLQAIASTRVLLGMYYTMVGRPAEALPVIEAAQPAATRLGAGLWKHRTRFMLGEPLLALGRFAEAGRVFREAALLSRGAEPPVVGLSNAFAALADLRRGDPEGALALIDGPQGAVLCATSDLRMQRFTALGLQAQIRLRAGRIEEGLEAAARAQVIAGHGRECNVFFAAFYGHAALCDVYLESWRRTRLDEADRGIPKDIRELQARARRACRGLRQFATLYPAARACADLMSARLAELAGEPRRARVLARRSLAHARHMGLSFDEAHAQALLARRLPPRDGDALVGKVPGRLTDPELAEDRGEI